MKWECIVLNDGQKRRTIIVDTETKSAIGESCVLHDGDASLRELVAHANRAFDAAVEEKRRKTSEGR